MSGFCAVNTTLTVAHAVAQEEPSTPTTPQPNKTFAQTESNMIGIEDAAKTPTRDSFGALAGQRPLPSAPFTPSHTRADSKLDPPSGLSREGSHVSTKSVDSSQDVEMSDDKDEQEGSDNESVDGDSSKPSKKKKGQRFFCKDFPPCQLSFTRSEHLARHIRKHTGERPFQCHCNRRFSRLDNLRQHAQTVHVNEDIPGDSLAATGSRFQRQIRTERVRPQTNRSRASTLGSQTGHSRGHSRNLSSSSMTSVSTTSSIGRDDFMRDQTPIASSNDVVRARLNLDTYATTPVSQRHSVVGGQSPGGYSTPTSATFSVSTGSPRYSLGHSPVSNATPRSINWEPRTPGRRLSVPGNPFTPQRNGAYPTPYISPLPSAQGSVYSSNNSILTSPTSSYSNSRRDSISVADLEWRRRTWHPGTHTSLTARPGTSGLNHHQTPDSPRSVFPSVRAASQVTRLPGIESFDKPPQTTAPRRVPSPMQIDRPTGPVDGLANLEVYRSSAPVRTHHTSWDAALHNGFTNLDLTNATPPKEGMQHGQPLTNDSERMDQNWRSTTALHPTAQGQNVYPPPANLQVSPCQERLRFSDPPSTSRYINKRHGWYNGPVHPNARTSPAAQSLHPSTALRTSPDVSNGSEGVQTPAGCIIEHQPTIIHSNGYVEKQSPEYRVEVQQKGECSTHSMPPLDQRHEKVSQPVAPVSSHEGQPVLRAQQAAFALQHIKHDGSVQPQGLQPLLAPVSDLSRLDALVAVATREEEDETVNRAPQHISQGHPGDRLFRERAGLPAFAMST